MKMQPPVKRDFSQPLSVTANPVQEIQQPQNAIIEQPKKDVQKKETRGRKPIEFTEMLVQEILAGFQMGWSDEKVCEHVQIARNTLYKKMKEDQKFMNDVRLAKRHQIVLAGEAINDILVDRANKDRGPMARFIYTKRLKDTFGDEKLPTGTQNNFFIITNEQLATITSGRSTIGDSAPTELLENLEASQDMDVRAEEGSTAPVYQEEVQSLDSQSSSMPQSSSTL